MRLAYSTERTHARPCCPLGTRHECLARNTWGYGVHVVTKWSVCKGRTHGQILSRRWSSSLDWRRVTIIVMMHLELGSTCLKQSVAEHREGGPHAIIASFCWVRYVVSCCTWGWSASGNCKLLLGPQNSQLLHMGVECLRKLLQAFAGYIILLQSEHCSWCPPLLSTEG